MRKKGIKITVKNTENSLNDWFWKMSLPKVS